METLDPRGGASLDPWGMVGRQIWAYYFESNALNKHYLPKMCIELALALLDFEKVMH